MFQFMMFIFMSQITHIQSIGSQFELLPPRETVAASDAFGVARQQLQNTELW